MRTVTALVLGGLLALSVAGCARDPSIEVDGQQRTFVLHVPEGLSDPAPLVLVLHPFTGSGRQMQRVTGLDALADREGFIVAYPNGRQRRWNVGVFGEGGVNDVAFVDALIDHIAAAHPVDPSRVYVTGGSNGGMMAQYYTCVRPERVAAVAPIFGTLPRATGALCPPGPPKPALFIHGTEDPVLPYDGGGEGVLMSVEENVAFWTARDGCPGTTVETALPDTDPCDGTTTRRVVYTGCAADAELYIVEGGGHTWPGGGPDYPRWIVGRTARDFSASETIWAFFRDKAAL